MGKPIDREILEQVNRLPVERQRQVLAFARSLGAAEPVGVAGERLLAFAGDIEPDDLGRMAEAIKERRLR